MKIIVGCSPTNIRFLFVHNYITTFSTAARHLKCSCLYRYTAVSGLSVQSGGSADCLYLLLNKVIWCQQWSHCLIICLPARARLTPVYNPCAIHPIQTHCSGRLARACAWMSTHTDGQNPLEWPGWQLMSFDTNCSLVTRCCATPQCSPPIQNAERTEMHSPQNSITKAGGQPVDGSGYYKQWDICRFPFDHLIFQHMWCGEEGEGENERALSIWQLSTQVMWFSQHVFKESDPQRSPVARWRNRFR